MSIIAEFLAPMSSSRRRLVRTLVVGTSVVLVSAACSSAADKVAATHDVTVPSPATATSASPSPTPTTPSTPAALLASAEANAKAHDWAHIVVTNRLGSQTETMTQDSGPDEGQQDIRLGAVVAKVIVKDEHAYIQGNAAAVTGYFGFPAQDASVLAGRWISIPSSNSAYATVADAVTLDSALAELGLTGDLTETAPTTRDGLTVIGIRGTDSSPDSGGGTGTMYVTATDPLPVEFDSTSSEGTEQVQLSGWGESVDLFAPDDALTIPTAPKA